MKRHGELFEKTFCRENLYAAYRDARQGKRKKRACFVFEKNLGTELEKLYQEVQGGTYRPDPYYSFIVREPKERVIHAPSFRDVVLQHAIYRVIYPVFNRTFIDTSFACRKGYGTHKARDYAREALRKYSADSYTLKLDIRKFFYSIDRVILKSLLERKIKDKGLIRIMMLFAEMESDTGIPIGNLLSQLYALIYLNPLDHYVKRILHVKHYARYVDDCILFGCARNECFLLRENVKSFLDAELKLALSKATIQKIKRGINFVGYRIWQDTCLIRKYSLQKFRRKILANDQAAIASLLGHARNTHSRVFMLRQLNACH